MPYDGPSGPEEEIRDLLENYDRRLRVLQHALRAIRAPKTVKLVERILEQNVDAIQRLRVSGVDDLENLWNIARMKAAYCWLAKDPEKTKRKFKEWSKLPSFRDALEEYNRTYFGSNTGHSVLPFTFPVEFRSHLMLILNFLSAHRRRSITRRRFEDLLMYLEEKPQLLRSIKGLRGVEDGEDLDEVILEKVEGHEEIREGTIPVKIYLSLTCLVFVYRNPSRFPCNSRPTVFLDKISRMTLEKTDMDDEHQLVLESNAVFYGRAKLIIVRDKTKRDDFYAAFHELKDN